MWQIYSPCQDAIRVRTTVGKLIQSIWDVKGDSADESCFIGRVNYLSENDFENLQTTIFSDGLSAIKIAESLTVKHEAYKHENEVRLIYIGSKETKHRCGMHTYEVDPLSLIDQATVDGRVSEKDYQHVEKEIMSRTGLEASQICHSRLYRYPKYFIVEIP